MARARSAEPRTVRTSGGAKDDHCGEHAPDGAIDCAPANAALSSNELAASAERSSHCPSPASAANAAQNESRRDAEPSRTSTNFTTAQRR
jgi:hypothetical protein